MNTKVPATNLAKQVKALRRRQTAAEKSVQKERDDVGRGIRVLGKSIANGKATTGDRITDYFIVAYGALGTDHETKPFRELEKQMAGKKGELFLVVRREEKQHVFRGCFGSSGTSPSDYHLETRYSLGVLTDDVLVLEPKKQDCGLPTIMRVELTIDRLMHAMSGSFMFGFRGLSELGMRISAGHDVGVALEIIIGDAAVFKYSPHQSKTINPDWIITRNEAARILGKNVSEAPEEKAAREEEQGKILDLLEEKRHECKRLSGQGPRYSDELKKCREQLRQAFGRAKELGLGNKPQAQLAADTLEVTPG